MNRIANVIKMHDRDRLSWFLMPFIVLGSSFLVNYLVSFFSETAIYTGGILSIFVYMLVVGILVLPQTFNFAISFSIRRIDYFFGTSLYGIAASIIFAVGTLLLSIIEYNLTGGWGTSLHFFHLPYLNDGNLLQQFLIYLILMLSLFFSGLIVGSIYRRFKGIGMLILTIVSIVIFTLVSFLITYKLWWDNIINWLVDHTAFELSLWMAPFILIFALISFLLLRKSTV
ncbi:MAG: hypothetical protein ACE3L7_21385 [Candidatus Pristimantibacillus sp.]